MAATSSGSIMPSRWVFSGSAISVVARSALVPGMRRVGRAESFPDLPEVDLVLHRAPGLGTASSHALAEFVTRILRLG